MYELTYQPIVLDKWEKLHNIPLKALIEVDWNMNDEKALKSLPFGASKGICKMVAGRHIGVSKKMKEWKFQEHDMCP